jgi:hypothetical protein
MLGRMNRSSRVRSQCKPTLSGVDIGHVRCWWKQIHLEKNIQLHIFMRMKQCCNTKNWFIDDLIYAWIGNDVTQASHVQSHSTCTFYWIYWRLHWNPLHATEVTIFIPKHIYIYIYICNTYICLGGSVDLVSLGLTLLHNWFQHDATEAGLWRLCRNAAHMAVGVPSERLMCQHWSPGPKKCGKTKKPDHVVC